MCCFIVPMVQAVATTAYRKHIEKSGNAESSAWKSNIPTLEKFLWGGTIVLLVDHIISGELSWRFPFLTALGYGDGVSVILKEMLTVGVPMSVVVTVIWAAYVMLKSPALKRSAK